MMEYLPYDAQVTGVASLRGQRGIVDMAICMEKCRTKTAGVNQPLAGQMRLGPSLQSYVCIADLQ
jgi:hypothetical protein